jgi:ribosomal protein S1
MDNVEWYEMDWSKINTIESLVEVMQAIDIKVSNIHPKFEKIKHLLVLEVNHEKK